MCCHVRSASLPKRRRPPSQFPPRDVVFDLADPVERHAHDAIQRLHSGPSPLFNAHAMRRCGNELFVVATSRHGMAVFVKWILSATACEVRWWDYPTLDAARAAFSVGGAR